MGRGRRVKKKTKKLEKAILKKDNKTVVSFPGGASALNLPANTGDIRDTGSIPGPGRSPGGGNGNTL